MVRTGCIDGKDRRAHLGLVVFAQQGYFVIAINPSGSTTFGQGNYHLGVSSFVANSFCLIFKILRMPSRKTGEENHLSIFVMDGNIYSITILRLGPYRPGVHVVLDWALQIDKDRAVAAGASYGGYAIKCILEADLLGS